MRITRVFRGIFRMIDSTFQLRSIIGSLSGKQELTVLNKLMADLYTRDLLRHEPKYQLPLNLNQHERQVFSQNGEDGIIEEIFNRIGSTDRYFVEIGVHALENNSSYLLVKGWNGHWIEADASHMELIHQKYAQWIEDGSLTSDTAFVSKENINRLFEKAQIPSEFDLFSIDINGNDYWIWETLNSFKPKVVVIEYNASYPPSTKFVQQYYQDFAWQVDTYFGASLKSLQILGEEKGYSLVACDITGTNAFFVRSDLAKGKFDEPFTAENHYEPDRHFLNRNQGYRRGIGRFLRR